MTFFKRIFGHERSASGKTLDKLVFGCIVIAVVFGLYAGWKALLIVIACGALIIFGVPLIFYIFGRARGRK